MSTKPILVIVSGAPASGKTTLGRRLAEDFQLPFIGKDDIKEILFETLGWSDRAWSIKLGIATYHLLYQAVEVQLRAQRSLVVESNFRAGSALARFLALQETYGFEPFQIICRADRDVILARYLARAQAGQRHPGHIDHVVHSEMLASMTEEEFGVMPIGGASVVVDTTNFAAVNFEHVSQTLRAFIDGVAPSTNTKRINE